MVDTFLHLREKFSMWLYSLVSLWCAFICFIQMLLLGPKLSSTEFLFPVGGLFFPVSSNMVYISIKYKGNFILSSKKKYIFDLHVVEVECGMRGDNRGKGRQFVFDREIVGVFFVCVRRSTQVVV